MKTKKTGNITTLEYKDEQGFTRSFQCNDKEEKCTVCKKEGHAKDKCHFKGQGTVEANSVACFQCREKGNWKRQCPNRKRCHHCKKNRHLRAACPYLWKKAPASSLKKGKPKGETPEGYLEKVRNRCKRCGD